jgi:Apea-like HEPN
VTYSFRIQFKRAPNTTLQHEANSLELLAAETGSPLRLLNPQSKDAPLLSATELVLVQNGYDTRSAATSAGRRYQDALLLTLARHRIGADFGARTPGGSWTEYGLSWLEQQVGGRVLNNAPGLSVFATDPWPKFATFEPKGVRGEDPNSFRDTFQIAASIALNLSERHRLALSLFNSSFFQDTQDSRFLLLMMTIEALIEPLARAPQAQKHVQSLIDQTKEAELEKRERESIIGALRWLTNESISSTGQLLVDSRLNGRTYAGRPPGKFFKHCYNLRSSLVHGNLPYPTFDDVRKAIGDLELMVADLISSLWIDTSTSQANAVAF